MSKTPEAFLIDIRGTVQGVGFRPFVHGLARRHNLRGRVCNNEHGVAIRVEGDAALLARFLEALKTEFPPFAVITSVEASPVPFSGFVEFRIDESAGEALPTAAISPDLPVCDDCLAEMLDPSDRRHAYPYINCTNCGPRFSIIRSLPYDRAGTTMAEWPMCPACSAQYEDVLDRRFHAQPLSCPVCGPNYSLIAGGRPVATRGIGSIIIAAEMLRTGSILAVKGLGGYHLACDAFAAESVSTLRTRKFRKEKPFAVMVRDMDAARAIAVIEDEASVLLQSPARPIVLLPSRIDTGVLAPGMNEIGVMLPYAPLHHLLFESGAPRVLVMTSANRSSEPIAYTEADAFDRLQEMADAFLMGERKIQRRVDDSVVRSGIFGPTVLRRSRGYAPSAPIVLPSERPILAVGADLKNTVTLLVGGRAFVSQYIGDLEHLQAREAHDEAIEDLLSMYRVPRRELLIAHDAHPGYASTQTAMRLEGDRIEVQHHRAHIASVLAEHGFMDTPVVGISLDGTGWGDDETIWGGEIFAGELRGGLRRVDHFREALLPGGDAAARHPVQAAAGFLWGVDDLPDMEAAPFSFPAGYRQAWSLLSTNTRVFRTTSAGRLFDAAAAIAGFTRPITFEGQAAMWLEQQALLSDTTAAYPFPGLDYRPLLHGMIVDRLRGVPAPDVARAFHRGLAKGLLNAAEEHCTREGTRTLALSGGVLQNQVLLAEIAARAADRFDILTNRQIPCNDGGISPGQAAVAAMSRL